MWTGDRSLKESSTGLRVLGAAIWRSRRVLAIWILLWTAAGVAYCGLIKPEFVAKVDIVIGPRHIANDGPEEKRHFQQLALDSEEADTELRILRSERLLRPVFDGLQLAGTPELAGPPNGFWSALAHFLHRFSPSAIEYDPRMRAFYAFADRVRCLRLGLSYVIEVSYRSQDRNRAAEVANAVAASYIADRLERVRAHLERVGGAYSAARADTLRTEIEQSRAAARGGAALDRDMDLADARILGPAVPPLTRTYPKTAPIVQFALGFGVISGVILILMLDRLRVNAAAALPKWKLETSSSLAGRMIGGR